MVEKRSIEEMQQWLAVLMHLNAKKIDANLRFFSTQ